MATPRSATPTEESGSMTLQSSPAGSVPGTPCPGPCHGPTPLAVPNGACPPHAVPPATGEAASKLARCRCSWRPSSLLIGGRRRGSGSSGSAARRSGPTWSLPRSSTRTFNSRSSSAAPWKRRKTTTSSARSRPAAAARPRSSGSWTTARMVKKGDLLVDIDDSYLQEQAQAKKIDRDKAEADKIAAEQSSIPSRRSPSGWPSRTWRNGSRAISPAAARLEGQIQIAESTFCSKRTGRPGRRGWSRRAT